MSVSERTDVYGRVPHVSAAFYPPVGAQVCLSQDCCGRSRAGRWGTLGPLDLRIPVCSGWQPLSVSGGSPGIRGDLPGGVASQLTFAGRAGMEPGQRMRQEQGPGSFWRWWAGHLRAHCGVLAPAMRSAHTPSSSPCWLLILGSSLCCHLLGQPSASSPCPGMRACAGWCWARLHHL